jgi:DNA-binding LacI/PurR family transcriptional regulator
VNQRTKTIEDVASASGVSVATVSRALRGLPNVAPSTRSRVQEVADAMHYRPHPSAAALAAGRTQTVAMGVPLLDSWYFSQVMAGAEAILSEARYDLLLFAMTGDERRQRMLRGPLVKRADGLILVDVAIPTDEAAVLVSGPLEVVTVGMELNGVSAVVVDDHQIAHDAVTHLIELGHRDIAVIEGPTHDPLRFAVPAERHRGYEAALKAAGIAAREQYSVHGNFLVEGGREAMALLLDLENPPTAVFAMSDEMAFGAIGEIRDRGLSVPHDVSIVGIDDHEFSSVIGLTTYQQAVAEHGAIAARVLLQHIADPDLEPRIHRAETTFIDRSTTSRRSDRQARPRRSSDTG